jgi:hypothetical protein
MADRLDEHHRIDAQFETLERDVAARQRVTQWGSIAALAISALALAVGAYQTRLMQTQARASVWPYVVLGFHYAEKGEHPEFALHVDNNGVGPALVRSVQVSFDGKPIEHWKDIFPLLLEHGTIDASISGLRSVVIPPNTNRETTIDVLKIPGAVAAKAMFDARERLKIDICYCSIYDDCWVAHWLKAKLDTVPACREAAQEFDY